MGFIMGICHEITTVKNISIILQISLCFFFQSIPLATPAFREPVTWFLSLCIHQSLFPCSQIANVIFLK